MKSLISLNEEKDKMQKQKDTFFASVNHELRNPLNLLIGCLDILQSSEKKEPGIMETAKNCGEILLNLIGNLFNSNHFNWVKGSNSLIAFYKEKLKIKK